MQNDSTLRAIATRLTVTPVEDLPRISGFLATSLAQCSLEDHFSDNKKATSSSVAAHKLRTRITSLLQDRSTAGRLTAAVLIKAVVDNGGSNVLSNSDVWARGLLGCLNKPDPVHVKKLYLATVTRIFVLTQNHPTLLREVTTPLLPPFITACLNLIKPVKGQFGGKPTEVASPLLNPVLQCWSQLLPQHPTIFRPFVTRMKLVSQSLLENIATPTSTKELASTLLCLLISCAPKNTAPQEWTQMASCIISSAHHTADKLFRAVLEEYEPSDTSSQRLTGKHNFSKDPRIPDKDQLGLSAWTGIEEGSSRLVTLIDLLRSLISIATPHSVAVPVGSIFDLTSRLLLVILPESKSNGAFALRHHNEASREEKEQLWLYLPHIHVSCLDLVRIMNGICGQSLLAVEGGILNQLLAAFGAMSGHDAIREGVYKIFQDILGGIDVSELKLSRTNFALLVEQCSNDLKRSLPSVSGDIKANASRDGFLDFKSNPQPGTLSLREQSKVHQAAWALLPEIIANSSMSMVSRQARIEMDRLSVLLDHKDAMLASVMHPMPTDRGKAAAASLLPFLARSAADVLTTEALLRPRMPVVQTATLPAGLSQMENVPVNDIQHENEADEASDILSRLEDSLDAMQGTSDFQEQTPEAANVVAGKEDGEETPMTATKKRTLADVDDINGGEAAQVQVLAPRETKMPRLEEKSLEEAMLQPNSAADTLIERPQVSTFADLVNLASTPKDAMLSETTAKHAFKGVDSDSDDSEIPEIDIGFDTDEEDSE